jgi:ATP-dependent Clp protease ATP-binding subunit ClpA
MQLANDEAGRFKHEYIGTEHILLGLVKEDSGRGIEILKELAVDPCKVRLEIEKIIGPGPDETTVATRPLTSPLTPRARKVLDHAKDAARDLNHNYIDTEHLLLGLLREEDAVAGQVLTNLGVKLKDVGRGATWIPVRAFDIPSKKALANLPADAPEAAKDLDAQIHRLDAEKETAVANAEFEKAAYLRDQADKLKKERARIIREARQKPK